MTSPRIALAHRILTRALEVAGVATITVPDPEAGVLEMAPAWVDLGAEGVALLAGRRWPLATVELEPLQRPATAVVRVHVAQLATSPGDRDRPELVADVTRISPALLTDLGFQAP